MAGAQSPFSSMDPNRQQQAASYQGQCFDKNWRTGMCVCVCVWGGGGDHQLAVLSIYTQIHPLLCYN